MLNAENRRSVKHCASFTSYHEKLDNDTFYTRSQSVQRISKDNLVMYMQFAHLHTNWLYGRVG